MLVDGMVEVSGCAGDCRVFAYVVVLGPGMSLAPREEVAEMCSRKRGTLS